MKLYAGIGSRQTPPDIQDIMTTIATKLEEKGYILQSGAANGADLAFERGVLNPNNKKIYLPWKGFNKSTSPYFKFNKLDEATQIATTFHKGFTYLSQGAQKLMTRNTYQVLGENLDEKVKFVICWTPDGCESHQTRGKITGGTGQAISLADHYKIPIFNLANPVSLERLVAFIEK